MNKFILLITGILFFLTSLYSYGQTETYSTYEEMHKVVVNNFREGKFEEAAKILNSNLEIFPEKLVSNTYNLALCYGNLEKYKEGADILMKGIETGVWYSKWGFEREFWKPYKELEEFQEFLKINEVKRIEAQKDSRPDMLIIKPDDFDASKEYPLFFALHGGGGTMKGFEKLWKSELMQKEFIIVYLQSSQLISMDTYTWDDMDIASYEITNAYIKILDEYLIDTTDIIIGGFSAGGRASLAALTKSNIPFSGFIILSPPMPEDFSSENVKFIKSKGIRGTIISNSKDPRFKDQRYMSELFKENGMQYQFIETPAIGHWFPENIDELIDHSIFFTRNK